MNSQRTIDYPEPFWTAVAERSDDTAFDCRVTTENLSAHRHAKAAWRSASRRSL